MTAESLCVICSQPLAGRQRRFCSRRCKNRDTNHRLQSYVRQQARGLKRKVALLGEVGACCGRCGYRRNLAALAWHHLNPADKVFSLDLRSLSNRGEQEIRREVAKCIVLCANCHAETHHPHLAMV